jgi:transposase
MPVTPTLQAPLAPIHVSEQLRMIFQAELPEAKALLAGWISWAERCRIPAFAQLAKNHQEIPAPNPQRRQTQPVQRPIRSHQHPSAPALPTRLRIPQPESLIAIADLTRGGLCLPIPGRS